MPSRCHHHRHLLLQVYKRAHRSQIVSMPESISFEKCTMSQMFQFCCWLVGCFVQFSFEYDKTAINTERERARENERKTNVTAAKVH